jgi:hypothetical protein
MKIALQMKKSVLTVEKNIFKVKKVCKNYGIESSYPSHICVTF